MNATRFDDLARLVGRARSRRHVLRAVSGFAVGSLAIDGARDTLASGDTSSSSCAAHGTVCGKTSDCCSGVCSGGHCVNCGADTDCPGADVCVDNECVAAACDDSSGCGSGQVCCGGTCELGECCSDADCPGASVCATGDGDIPTCEVVRCADETDCDAGDLCCGGVCQESACCEVDDDCADGAACCDGACIPCPAGGVCGAAGSGVCACGAGQVACANGCAACCDDSDCDNGEACSNGVCAVACAIDTDCNSDQECVGGVCVCADGLLDCDGTCAECCTFTDCPGTDICRDGECGPLCFDSGEACNNDEDCCEGSCESGFCKGFNVVALPDTGTGSSR